MKKALVSVNFVGLLFCLCLISNVALADIKDGNCADGQVAQVSTEHSIQLRDKNINYTATAGFMEVLSKDKSAKACIFYTSYVVHGEVGVHPRPITFAFNGGPGSASLWLHLGLMGPKRVDMGSDGLHASHSLDLIDNVDSPLDLTDVVMIDPVASGFSHAEDKANTDKFFGVENDYRSIASFIQGYLNTNNRWTSRKYILGESYGGVRGSLLTNYLQSQMGIAVDGLILVSPALSNITFDMNLPDNNIPHWTNFPTLATTAWYHKKISPAYQNLGVEAVYSKAKQFAETDLRNALDLGYLLDNARMADLAQTMADFVGISAAKIQNQNLRISSWSGDFLQDRQQATGSYDSRFVIDLVNSDRYTDPSGTLVGYSFVAGINQYLRKDLNFISPSPYNEFAEISNWPAGEPLNYEVGVISDLGQALAGNPRLKLMVASGYFDLVCPVGGVEYELSQIPGRRKFAARVSNKKYFGGHMMYINPEALAQLKKDLTVFMSTDVDGNPAD